MRTPANKPRRIPYALSHKIFAPPSISTGATSGLRQFAVALLLSVQQPYSNRQDMWLSDGLTLLGNFSGLSCFPMLG